MDRLDYLLRDSFFTGVSEGVVSSDRIIKMLCVANDQLVVEAKGIYSIEKFLIARRLMYWQVYLHKTALVAEKMLVNLFRRARQLSADNDLGAVPAHLLFFLRHQPSVEDFRNRPEVLDHFAMLDDSDIMTSLKSWTLHPDKVLSTLAGGLLRRELLAIEVQDETFPPERIDKLLAATQEYYQLGSPEEAAAFCFATSVENNTYSVRDDKINILGRNGQIRDISEASDMLDLSVLSKTVTKQILCCPKALRSPA